MKDVSQAVPEVKFQIGAKEYTIRCSFGLLARFQKATGLNPFDEKVWSEPSPWTFAALIWAGIVREHPQFTIEMVADELSIHQATQVKDILIGMMESGVAAKKEEAPTSSEAPAPTPTN